MIHVRELRVRFGKTTVVDGLDMEVAPGESVALWGENGAGKTTAIRALLGLVPFRGSVHLAGHDVRHDGKRARAAVGYVPQRLALYDDLRALAFLRFIAGLRRAAPEQPARLLERVGLGAHGAKRVGKLSGGMRQRLALAAALLGDPPLLILDEPTASLDAAARSDFVMLLGELRADGKTLLLTTHRLEEITALSDSVLLLADGRACLRCPAHELERHVRPSSTLRLRMAPAALDAALAVLEREGFEARRNGHGLLVAVAPGQRAAPVAALVRADLTPDDMSMEDRA